MQHDLTGAERRDHDEPHEDQRTKQPAHSAGPLSLDQEQADQDGQGDRHDQVRQARGDDLQALDGRCDRDRRGDHAVPEEQPGTEDPERDEQRCAADAAALDQCGERHAATVTAVVNPHQQAGVLIETISVIAQKMSEITP